MVASHAGGAATGVIVVALVVVVVAACLGSGVVAVLLLLVLGARQRRRLLHQLQRGYLRHGEALAAARGTAPESAAGAVAAVVGVAVALVVAGRHHEPQHDERGRTQHQQPLESLNPPRLVRVLVARRHDHGPYLPARGHAARG
eukprot:scaffold7960_cov350-Prasinococcus_capsulatus_cf.AAC.2